MIHQLYLITMQASQLTFSTLSRDLTLIIIISILTLLTIHYFLHRRPKPNLPPGHFPWPIIGNLHQIQPLQHHSFSELNSLYGPIISVWIGSSLKVIVSSASLAKEVLKNNDHIFSNRPRTIRTMSDTKNGSDLIWSDYNPMYVKLKKLTMYEFLSPKSIRESALVREEEVSTLVQLILKWCEFECKNGETMELRKYLNVALFNSITRMVLGKRYIDDEGVTDEEGLELKGIILELAECNKSMYLTDWISCLRGFGWLGKDRFWRCQDRKDRFSRTLLEECMERVKESDGELIEGHFLGALVRLKEEHDLSDDNIVGLVWDMFHAGLDTSVATVEWAMAHLVKSPFIMAQAQYELDSVIGPDNVMTEMDIPKLQFLKCIVKETLRLHPPTPLMLPHKANADAKIGGYDIPKGTIVEINIWAIARDQKVWNDDAEMFRPGRFVVNDVDMIGHDFRLIPFGSGRRMCPGMQLGINFVVLMLGRLLHRFSWRVEKDRDIDMSDGTGVVCYMKHPLRIVPSPR